MYIRWAWHLVHRKQVRGVVMCVSCCRNVYSKAILRQKLLSQKPLCNGYHHSKCWGSGASSWVVAAGHALAPPGTEGQGCHDELTTPRCGSVAAALLLLCAGVPGRYVRRRYDPISGIVSVAGVEEQHGIQAAAGDLLYLKGNAFPGLLGECDV